MNCRRFAFAATSGSGGAPAPGESALALRAFADSPGAENGAFMSLVILGHLPSPYSNSGHDRCLIVVGREGLSNLVLDDLDRELEKRGHRFVRYADDCVPRRREREVVMTD